MNKSELKKILRPLIKECVKEVIFEEGTLSTIISEVLKGTSGKQVVRETKKSRLETNEEANSRLQKRQNMLQENRKKMLDAIGKDAYNGVDLFEGTTPTQGQRNTSMGGSKALEGVSPSDPGVDISNFGLPQGLWKKLSGS
jgi:hypothetical protein